MTDEGSVHKTVLLNEAIKGLNLHQDAVVVDATFGGGGHSKEILKRFPKTKIIALDQDASVWKPQPGISFHNENFRNLDKVLEEKVDGIIFDLGLSSDQLGDSGRGFSFMKDEPLLMTMKKNVSEEDLTAREVVNEWSEESLEKIIYGFGEEKFARRIARAIVSRREVKKIERTADLVEVISGAVPAVYKRSRLHFATRTFQAIRIAVNDELGALKEGLEKGFRVLKPSGRMAVISFHSLEDRIVKRFFSAKGGSASGGKENRVANVITKKPITPTEEEIKNNPRARSAKLRILEKI